MRTSDETAGEFIARKTMEFQRGKNFTRTWGAEADRKAKVEAWTFMVEPGYGKKVFLFERMRYTEGDEPFYRISYYMVNDDGAWTWMRGCPLFSKRDFEMLCAMARVEGTLL